MEENKLYAPYKLKILVTIVDRSKTMFFIDTLESYEVNMQTVIYGKGTAPKNKSMILNEDKDKAIIISLVKEKYIKEIMDNYEEKYFKIKNGKGIAFTISLNSIIGKNLYNFLANVKESDFKWKIN